uniref:DM10 domain-containing protein n=1 Tax=Ascaris lumbricoides TaxID=6252 RepID=A0A0M3HHD2_ASCLU
MRPTNLEEFLAIKPSREKLFVWVRSSQKLSDNPRIHRMMAVYNTDSTLAGVALKAHQRRVARWFFVERVVYVGCM